MNIHPSVTEKVGESESPEGDVAPILDVRETNTVVKIRDGQTVIIAGLMQEREEREVTGVPFFEKLPLFGSFFRKTVEERKKTELVIMLTPEVAVGNDIENQSVQRLSAEWKEVK
jgi:type II secretory pathway component GspD/PulD (secretin)